MQPLQHEMSILVNEREKLETELKQSAQGLSIQSLMLNPSKALNALPIIEAILENNKKMLANLDCRVTNLELLDYGK